MNLSILLPTYNESKNIIDLLNEINRHLKNKKISFECIVVDDDSPDDTYELVLNKSKNDHKIAPILRKKDHGLARSILEGIKNAKGENILVMDSDFNHDPKMIWQMYCLLEFYDLVVGSRFVYSGGMEDTMRNKLSYLFNLIIRIILGTHIQDNLSGFFIIKKKLLLPFANKKIFTGYGEYFIKLLYRAKITKYRIIEVPVYYNLRRHGQSKSNFLKMFITYSKTVLEELIYEVQRTKSLKSIFNR